MSQSSSLFRLETAQAESTSGFSPYFFPAEKKEGQPPILHEERCPLPDVFRFVLDVDSAFCFHS